MGYNIDNILQAGDLEMQHRIKRYDVKWGRPPFSVSYKRMSFSRMPAYYWSMEDSGTTNKYSVNLGYTGSNFNAYYSDVDLTFAKGQADPTDNAIACNGMVYATASAVNNLTEFAAGYTISSYVKLTQNVSNSYCAIVSKQHIFATGGLCTVYAKNVGASTYLAVASPSGPAFEISNAVLTLNQWQHVALTVAPEGELLDGYVGLKHKRSWSRACVYLYLDGILVYEGHLTGFEPVEDSATFLIGACNRSNGTPDLQAIFRGWIDEVAVYTSPLGDDVIKKLATIGGGLSYVEPLQDFDSDAIETTLVATKYGDLIKGDGPSGYFKMDTRATTGSTIFVANDSPFPNYGVTPLILNGESATNSEWYTSSDSALNKLNKPDLYPLGAIKFSGQDNYGCVTGLKYYTAKGVPVPWNSYSGMSGELWFKPSGTTSSDIDGIMGYPNCESGFVMSISDGTELSVRIMRPGVEEILQYGKDIWQNSDKFNGSWYHFAFTVTPEGEATLFFNGEIVVSKNIGKGAYIPSIGDTFYVGGCKPWNDPYNDIPPFWGDEVAVYGFALSAEQIKNHYLTGVGGPYRRQQLSDTDDPLGGTPYILNANEYSILENEVDITKYVADYSVDYDIKQLVPTGSMSVYEEWGSQQIADYLRANSYVIIERRYISQNLNADSGWQPVGHFFVEGPMGMSIDSGGRRVCQVSLKGITKLLSLDYANIPIEPDKIFMHRQALTCAESTVEWSKFKLPHPVIKDGYYENWAESPSVKLWVTNFKNIGDGAKGGVESSKEVLRIKGSDGAIHVLGGEGAVVIDNDFLWSSISDGGLGQPETIMAEFYRYARPYDVTTHTVSSIVYNQDSERWNVQFDGYSGALDGKSLFVKSGIAKGKYFKIQQPNLLIDGFVEPVGDYVYGPTSIVTNVARTGLILPDFALSNYSGSWCAKSYKAAQAGGGLGYKGYRTPLLKTALTVGGNTISISDSAKLVGIELSFDKLADPTMFGGIRVKDSGNYIAFNDTVKTGSMDDTSIWTTGIWSTTTVGGIGQLWDLPANLTWGSIKTWLSTMCVYAGIVVEDASTGLGVTVAYREFHVKLYLSESDNDDPEIYLVDLNGIPINPTYEGLAVGDVAQVGDFNRIEDALRKVSLCAYMQENDSTYPFYFDYDPCPAVLAPSVVPLRSTILDAQSWVDIAGQILDAAPPNYKLICSPDGTLRAKLITVVPGAMPAHTLVGALDMNEDRSDYGIATRVIARGTSDNYVNVALNKASGGGSATRAYNLKGFCASAELGVGKTLSQRDADAIWSQVFNGNNRTPAPDLSDDWKRLDKYSFYGTILWAHESTSSVKRWTFEDVDLGAIDIGRTTTGRGILLDALEFIWFNQFLEGNDIPQTMFVYYMTEEDYEAVCGVAPPNEPNSNDTTYFPPANSARWRLLVDEVSLNDGENKVESADFVTGKPTKVRFLKFRVGQAHYRFPIIGNDNEDERAIATVNLAEVRAYTSENIVATAEIGAIAPFDTADYRQLATRLRRRTDILEVNPGLNTFTKVRDYAISELQERFMDFTPVTTTALAPTVEIGEVVRLVNPETLESVNYLVVAISHQKNGVAKMQLMNYEIRL